MNSSCDNIINLCPYLSTAEIKKPRFPFRQVLQVISLLIDGVATVGIGVCLIAGVYVFLQMV